MNIFKPVGLVDGVIPPECCVKDNSDLAMEL